MKLAHKLIYDNISKMRGMGLTHLTLDEVEFGGERQSDPGRLISIGGRQLVNFGSCSYLSLEHEQSVVTRATDAIRTYGTQYSSSRAYVSTALYRNLSKALCQVLGVEHLVLASTTTLAHASALPVLVNEGDVVIYDVQVHSSVQAVLPTLEAAGATCVRAPHNDLRALKKMIKEFVADLKGSKDKQRIFYLCDGLYSIHGDSVDVDELYKLLDTFPQLWAYVDDAHGLGWRGSRGAGTVLGTKFLHDRCIVTMGLSKCLAAGGGAIACPAAEIADEIFTCGNTLIFSGPIPPPLLGAALGSCELLLSSEFAEKQSKLYANIARFNELAADYRFECQLYDSPIKFIELGDEDVTLRVAQDLMQRGFFVNAAVFPAVARGHAGLRIMLNVKHSFEDLAQLCEAIVTHLR